MKRKIAVLFAATMALSSLPFAHASNILELYDYHGDEVTASVRSAWLGLFPQKDGQFCLKPTKVSITRVHDEIIDDDPKAKTGKRISVPGKEKPTFLFGGIPGLKAGAVLTSRINKKEHLQINDQIQLNVGDNKAKLIVKGKKEDKEYYSGFSITLESGGIKQQLVSAQQISIDTSPSLMWCGDLDGDGKVDLIMDTTTNYNVSDVTLFLSSKAKPGKLVKQVAHQYSTGC
ncbi:MAG: hypothetical protein K2X93_21235 [Candidatus Obscuribacterales bacterium]|nr:hypothetical protein [Candidatus Obscuribacterales bacterium]